MGGFGGGLFSVGLVGLISWAVLKFSGAKVGGASFGAFFLMLGLGFYGKNPLNILPVLMGTFLYAKVKKVAFGSVVNMGLFACALAPAVSEMMFGSCNPWSQGVGILAGVLVGLFIGFVFAPLAGHVATMHKGYNLYNAGLAVAFEPLSRAYGIPKDDPTRDEVMEKCLRDAAGVPFEILCLCCEAIELQVDFAAKGSVLAVSDAGTGVVHCKAALQGAAINVKVNTKAMKDRAYAAEIDKQVDERMEKYGKMADEVFEKVYGRFC